MVNRMPKLPTSVIAILAAQQFAVAQVLPATSVGSSVPMDDYLGLLAQIAPAARDGAETYLQAARRRCRANLTSAQLRRAMSEGAGDPILMGMIRASQLRDAKAIVELEARLDCASLR